VSENIAKSFFIWGEATNSYTSLLFSQLCSPYSLLTAKLLGPDFQKILGLHSHCGN